MRCPSVSRILLMYPAQVHDRLLIVSITSITSVFSLTQTFAFLSKYVIFDIILYIFICDAAACFDWFASANVSVPYYRLVTHLQLSFAKTHVLTYISRFQNCLS